MKRRILIPLLGALLLCSVAVSAAFADDSVQYVVKPGDTLSSIARNHSTTVNAIAAANGISNRINLIFPGELLIVPSRSPRVLIDRPLAGAALRGVATIEGRSDTFEATVALRVLDRNLREVGRGNAMGGTLGTLAPFSGSVTFSVPFAQVGYVEAFEASAKDGTPLHVDTVRVLLLPAGSVGETRYTVRFGDTLYSLARRFGTTVAKIAEANGITNVNRIFVGQVLVIPR